AGACESRIAELTHDARAEHERLDFVAIEHERWQVVPRTNAVPDPRLAVDRRAGEHEIADVAIHRALRHAEPLGDVRGGGRRAPASQQLDDLKETVGAAHVSRVNLVTPPSLRRGRSRDLPDPRTRQA